MGAAVGAEAVYYPKSLHLKMEAVCNWSVFLHTRPKRPKDILLDIDTNR